MSVTLTRDYIGGTPARIDISIPDRITTHPDAQASVSAIAYEGRATLLFGATPMDRERLWWVRK